MKPRFQVSADAIELIKRFEGFRRTAAQLSDGRWTIGYGHTKSARPGVEISEGDAEALLTYDLIEVVKAVNELTFTPLNQNQFDALVAFAFSVGVENFRSSGVLRRVNEGALLQAAFALEMWRKADFEGETIVVDALVRRRAAEKALFLKPIEGWIPAPSPVLQARVDFDALFSQPRQAPLHLVVPMDGETAQAREEERSDATILPETGFSSAEAAVEAVAARLQALIPDVDAGPQVAAEEPAAEPLAASVIEAGPPTASQEPIAKAAVDHPAQPAMIAPEAETAAPVLDPAPYIGPMGVERPKKKKLRKRGRIALMPYGPLLGLGLVFFFAGVIWGVQEKTPIGLGVALLGVILMAVALYYLLAQIDGEAKGS